MILNLDRDELINAEKSQMSTLEAMIQTFRIITVSCTLILPCINFTKVLTDLI